MAKYTELLSEYIENGGELPAVFEQIQGFKDLFIGEYCDCEIGFETPTLFTIKLETRANLVIPEYKQRIEEIEEAKQVLINPTKTRVRSGSTARAYGARDETRENTKTGEIINGGTDTLTLNNANHDRIEKDFPFATNASEPASVTPSKITTDTASVDTHTNKHNNTESYNNYNDTIHTKELAKTDTETYNAITDTESGFTSSEAEALFHTLESEVFLIKKELLREFKNLFMLVY